MDRPRILLTRRLPPLAMQRLHYKAEVVHGDLDQDLSRHELLERIKDVDGLLCLLTDKVDAELMDAAAHLKVVSNYAVGYNNIDVAAATERGLVVTNTPGVLTNCTADMAWALLMAAARRVLEGDALVRSGNWTGWEPLQLLGTEVSGATIGFVGMGRIAKATAKRAAAFDMKLLYWNRTRLDSSEEAELGLEYREFGQLFPECDFVSVHVALTDQTKHLIGPAEFESMKPTSILINTARGPVVDESALVWALEQGQIGGAGLDVFENEPIVEEELRSMENVVLAPHLGSATIATREKMGEIAVQNCLAVCRGEQPPHRVN
ncbi:D-glycerate dehydrogenase [Stieleria sp. JC731]|uniref:2-hydroxyacid dehydrogenase n=1 Tax=Pirellulaceae TaxID=2691357 RepID=UPI001E421D5E|nr:D-glycerate dehydrogenase [Stieleria sp. JC731]MCC9601423.1 D-glycerate dehydrogenase [Stieleria sp. JC731]